MLLKLYSKNNRPEDLQRIVDILNDGGIIIYPTDTVYALGCHALKERPIERICKLKNIDPRKNNLSIICYDLSRNRKEVGIRVPDNAIIREICRLLDAPILTTTLPLEEGEDIEYITEPELIDEKFGEKVDLIIDGGTGGIEPSTVINCCDDVPEIVRQGKGILNE